MSLLIVAGVAVALIFLIKIYYTVVTVKDYVDETKQQGASELDVSDVVNVSVHGKDEQSVKYDKSSVVRSKFNDPDNFIYNESMEIDKFD
jgi:hypothetical protein